LIDEASVYNRALSAAEIQAIFDAGQYGKRKASSGLHGALPKGNEFPESSRTGF
jgi:hypothetical protein